MATGKIKIVMDLDDGEFRTRMVKGGKVIRDFTKELKGAHGSLKKIEKGVTGFLPKLRDFLITASILKGGIHNLTRATVGWQLSLLKNIGEVERMTFLLKGMSTAATDAARSQEANQNLDYLLDLAERAPFSLGEMTNSFVKFKSVGLDPLDGSLEALNDSVAAFGGNDQILHRASVAIQQMAGKGVISMEELRQQLGEAVPSAIRLMARSVGLSYQELVDRVSKGQVEAKSALALTFQEFKREFGGSAERLMDTWVGMLNRLQTKWLKFQLAIGESKYFEEAKRQMQDLLLAFDDDSVKDIADKIGSVLTSIVKGVRSLIDFIIKYKDEMVSLSKAIGYAFAARAVLGGVGAIVGVFSRLTEAAASTRGSFAAAASHFDVAGAKATTLSGKLAGLASGMRGLGAAVSSMLGPISLAVAAIAGFATHAISARKAASDLRKEFELTSMGFDQKEIDQLGKKLLDFDKIVQSAAMNYQEAVERARTDKNYNSVVANRKKQLDAALAQYNAYKERLLAAQDDLTRRQSTKQIESYRKDAERRLEAARSAYKQEALIQDLARSAGVEDEDGERESRLFAIENFYDDMIQIETDALHEAKKVLLNGTKEGEAAWNAYIKVFQRKTAELAAEKKKALATGDAGATFHAGTQGGSKNIDRFYNSMLSKNAELRANLAGLNGELAKFDHLIDIEAFGKMSEDKRELIKQIRKEIVANKELTESYDKQKKTKSQIAALDKRLTAKSAELSEQLRDTYAAAFASPTDADNSVVERLRRQLLASLSTIDAANPKYAELKRNIESIVSQANDVNIVRQAADIAKKRYDIEKGLLTEKEKLQYEYVDDVEAATKRILALEGVGTDESKRLIDELYQYLESRAAEHARNMETPMQKMSREWQDMGKGIQDAMTGWADRATDAFVEFAKTGKASVSDLVESILSDLLKLTVQKNITGPLFSALSGGLNSGGNGGGLFDSLLGSAGSSLLGGGTQQADMLSDQWGFFDEIGSFFGFAKGGIMTGKGRAQLRKYASGGIAHTPQLAMFGEGSRPEAYVPLPDGKTIPVTMQNSGANVQVNVINQSGQQVEAEQGPAKFDGEKMVLDIVLSAANRPGHFRDSMRAGLK